MFVFANWIIRVTFIRRSKTCPKCRKPTASGQLLTIYLDVNNAVAQTNGSSSESSSLIDVFAKDRDLMESRLSQLHLDMTKYQDKFNEYYSKFTEAQSEAAMNTLCLEIYRRATIGLCRIYNVPMLDNVTANQSRSWQNDSAFERCSGIYEDHEAVASALANVPKHINESWSKHCWSAGKKLLVQSIALSVLFKWGSASKFNIAAVLAAGEVYNAVKLYQMKR